MAESEGGQEPWLTLAEAAKQTGRHPDGLRAAIRRGKLRARKNNAGQWTVQVPAGWATESDSDAGQDVAEALAMLKEELAESQARASQAESQLGRVEERLAASERREAALQADLDRERAELARLRRPLWERIVEAGRGR